MGHSDRKFMLKMLCVSFGMTFLDFIYIIIPCFVFVCVLDPSTHCWMNVLVLWALTWRERFSRLLRMLVSLCSLSHTDPHCGKKVTTKKTVYQLICLFHAYFSTPVSIACTKLVCKVFHFPDFNFLSHPQEVPHPPAAVRRRGRLALWTTGHSDTSLPHWRETASRDSAGWYSRDAASPQWALQNPWRRLCP